MDSAQLVPEFERRVRETKELLRIFGVGKNAISDDKKHASRESLRTRRGRDLGAGADSSLLSFKLTQQHVRQHCIGFDAVNITAFTSMHEVLVRYVTDHLNRAKLSKFRYLRELSRCARAEANLSVRCV